jgi:hypothetical protein
VLIAHPLNGQRNLLTKKDKQTGIISISSNYELIGKIGATGKMQFKLIQYLTEDTTMRLYFIFNRSTERCLGPGSKIIIKLGTILDTLNTSGMKHCSNILEDYAELYPNDINLLKQIEMDGFKIQYRKPDGFYPDAKFEDSFIWINPVYFIKTLKYFEK